MRTAVSLAACLLLTPVLSACADDPRPTATSPATTASSLRTTAAPTAPATAAAPATTAATAPAAAAPPTPAVTATAAPTTAPPPATPAGSRVRLTGDGIDLGRGVVAFGATFEQARPALDAALGRPTTDTGVIDSFSAYGTCPGTRLRALEYAGGALTVLFGDVAGPALTLYQWALSAEGEPSQVPQASALVGDAATYEFGVGTTVAELQDGARPAEVVVSPGDEVVSATFRVQDQSSGFFGYLTGTAPHDRATFVQGGEGCGE